MNKAIHVVLILALVLNIVASGLDIYAKWRVHKEIEANIKTNEEILRLLEDVTGNLVGPKGIRYIKSLEWHWL